MFSKEKLTHYLITLLASIAAVVTHGYQFAVSDQEIFIPYVLKWEDPSLFANDQLFNQPSAGASLFYPIFGLLARYFNLEAIFFLGYLIFQLFFFLAIYRLAFVILKDRKLAYLALLPFFLPKFIGGTAISTFDDFFGYRSIGVIFLLFYISYLLEKKFKQAITSASIGLLFHPLSIIPNILILPILYVREKFNFPRRIQIATVISLAILAVFLTLVIPRDNLWLSIIKYRDPYLFLSTWGTNGWLAMFLYVALIFTFIRRIESKLRFGLLLIIIISLVVFIGNFIILELFKIPDIVKFQLLRSITLIAYISLVMCPLFIAKKDPLPALIGLLAFIFLSLNRFQLFLPFFILYILFDNFHHSSQIIPKLKTTTIIILILIIAAANFLMEASFGRKSSQKIQYPKQTNDWIDLQKWVQNNTPKNSTFLVPPTQTGFRLYSQRPIVGDIKDGAVVIYSPQYAKKWFQIMEDIKNYEDLTKTDFLHLKDLYQFNYVATGSSHYLDFEIIYKNDKFTLYKI